jgi:hypothetical protein
MRAIQMRSTLKQWFAAAVSSAVLASCAQVTPPSTPDPPTNAPTALVYGMTASPIYEALKSKVRMTASNGSQEATDYDLIILDGDGFSGEQLSSDELIREAIHSGVWVLGLDVMEEDKNGLGEMLHGSSQGDVKAYLVRQAGTGDGRPSSRLIDFVNPDRKAKEVAQGVVSYITEQVIVPQQKDIPPRALTYLVHHTSDYSGLMPEVTSPAFQPGRCGSPVYWPCPSSQAATWVVDHYITVLLDAGTSPFGDFQHVVVETTGRANPGPLAINYIDSCGPAYSCEIAWIQTRFDASHTISAGSTPDKNLTLEKTSPTTINNTETVTTSSSFSVNFSEAPGVSGSYTYSKTDTKTIMDWEVNDVSDSAAQWQYASNTVYDGMNTDSYDSGAWSNFYWHPRPPNNLSVQNLAYDVKSTWNNNTVSADLVNIGGTDSAWYTDAFEVDSNYYPYPDDANTCSVYSCHCTTAFCVTRVYMARHNNKQLWNIAVNLAAVVPVPTKSLTFSPNPAVAGQTVIGTLTLSAPTLVPAQVLVSSDKPGIAPEHNTYTIPANEDTLTFNVVTGAEGCEPESATIQTFYADGQNQSLTVNPPPTCR